MKAALILNSKAKRTDRQNVRRLRDALKKTDLEIIEFDESDKFTMSQFTDAAVREGFDMVIAAGGDGTISSVATKLVGSNSSLGVIPMGTYNNFAKDLGIPLDLEEAVKNLVNGEPRYIDVGEVNGHHFINNSSIGLYPHLVLRREHREGRGLPRILATAMALLKVFQKYPMHAIKLSVDGQEIIHSTPLLFFGNGFYGYDGLDIGDRELPVNGKLSLYILKNAHRLQLIKLSIKALSKKIHNDPNFEKHFVREAIIELPKKYVFVAKDGEILRMESPLKYKIKNQALKVILPK